MIKRPPVFKESEIKFFCIDFTSFWGERTWIRIPSPATLGTEIVTEELIKLRDNARRSALYILGKSGMGKSWLMVNLMLQDIDNGHGLVFIDPHGTGIDDLIRHSSSINFSIEDDLINNFLIFDVENERQSFGINLLACDDVSSLKERNDTYTRAKGVFDKIWKNTYSDLPWLQEIIQYTLYALIENQGYTLADVPMFLTNARFRKHIVENIKYNRQVIDYWKNRFEPKRAEAALTRVDTLLGHPYVKDIIGQQKTTIDFSRFMNEKRIVLIKLSDRLSIEIKSFIGTVIISELLHAVKKRSTDNPSQFCVYVDEFQNFTNHEDFSTLITQARKYGIATTIAHQERYGQFAEHKAIIGATDATGSKICFQLSGRDAQDLAIEFEKPPPMETRREREMVISQEPVSDLLRGHANPEIRAFVNSYLRVMHERREDVKEDMGGERLIGQAFRDEAALYQLGARSEMAQDNKIRRVDYPIIQDAFWKAQNALLAAKGQTAKLIHLFERGKSLSVLIQALNKFLTAIMEGRIAPGQEQFSDFLLEHVHNASSVPDTHRQVFDLYIALTYGDPGVGRAVPYAFAKAHGFFTDTVKLLEQDAESKRKHALEEYAKGLRDRYNQSDAATLEECKKSRNYMIIAVSDDIKTRTQCSGYNNSLGVYPNVETLISYYVPLLEYPALWEILKHFLIDRFNPSWLTTRWRELEIVEIITENINSVCEIRQRSDEAKKEVEKISINWFGKHIEGIIDNLQWAWEKTDWKKDDIKKNKHKQVWKKMDCRK